MNYITAHMNQKDKVVFLLLLAAFLISVVFSKPVISQIAAFFYVLLFMFEFSNYLRDRSNAGIVWRYIGKYEELLGRFFVKILFSIITLFAFAVMLFSIYSSFRR